MTQHSLLHSLPHIRSCATRLITLVCPCSEVAKFCQKYLAAEITRLEKYHQGNLPDSLVEVRLSPHNLASPCNHVSDMWGDRGAGYLTHCWSCMQVFHRMDSMLKDTNYTAELDALRQTTHDAAASEMQTNAQNHADQGEEDGQVSTSEALDMLRQVGLCHGVRAQAAVATAHVAPEQRLVHPALIHQQ